MIFATLLASASLTLACESCHVPEGASLPHRLRNFASFKAARFDDADCVGCHVETGIAARLERMPGWLPFREETLGRVRERATYFAIPPLPAEDERRFTVCGLERYLAAPPPRRFGATHAMHSLPPEARTPFVARLDAAGALAPCPDPAPAPLVAEGGKLFRAQGCVGCHDARTASSDAASLAPRLRLGLPLWSYSWFAARVRHGTTGGAPSRVWSTTWEAADGRIARTATGAEMPAFPALSDGELLALHAYVTTATDDRPAVEPALPPETDGAPASFAAVQTILSQGCPHCHSTTPRTRAAIERTFTLAAPVPSAAPRFVWPLTPGAATSAVFSLVPPACATSPVLARLAARHREWGGTPQPERGMPLGLEPVGRDEIATLASWARGGCPSPRGALCRPCR